MKFKNPSVKKLALVLFTAFSLVSCNTPLQTNNQKELTNTEQKYQSNKPEPLNILRTADIEILNPFNVKVTSTPSFNATTTSTVQIKIDTVTYTLSYQFFRKLRLILANTPNLLLNSDFTKLTTNATVGDSSYLPVPAERAFATYLNTLTSVNMPNFLQGYNSGGNSEVNNNTVCSTCVKTPTATTPALITPITATPKLIFNIGFNDNQVPGAYSAVDQSALNIVQNTGMINRNANLQVPALTTNTVSNTNYAGAAVVLTSKLLLRNDYNNANSVSAFNTMYSTLGITTPAIASPVTFGNFHAAMRKIHDIANNTGTPRPSSLTFSYSGTGVVTTSGLGNALSQAGFGTQTLLTKGSVASQQNKDAINNWLNDPANLTALGSRRGIVVECSRTTGIVSFSSSTKNHTILVKYDGTNALYMYDPGMPNNPNTPSGTPNYRPMTSLEISALYASVNKLVGITSILAPVAPIATAATDITTTSFTANWNPVSGATGYNIVIDSVETTLGNVTSYPKSGLNIGTDHSYYVTAVNSGGTSLNSNTINVSTTSDTPPD